MPLQLIVRHGKEVGERKLASMKLKISFLVRVEMESVRWWVNGKEVPGQSARVEKKASSSEFWMLDPLCSLNLEKQRGWKM